MSRQKIIDELTALGVNNAKPKCQIGIIATGDQFVDSPQQLKEIMQQQLGTLAVEMEGAAVAQVCYNNKIPFVVVRTISDGANHLSEKQFPAFIEKIAKHYSEHIVTSMLLESVDTEECEAKSGAVMSAGF